MNQMDAGQTLELLGHQMEHACSWKSLGHRLVSDYTGRLLHNQRESGHIREHTLERLHYRIGFGQVGGMLQCRNGSGHTRESLRRWMESGQPGWNRWTESGSTWESLCNRTQSDHTRELDGNCAESTHTREPLEHRTGTGCAMERLGTCYWILGHKSGSTLERRQLRMGSNQVDWNWNRVRRLMNCLLARRVRLVFVGNGCHLFTRRWHFSTVGGIFFTMALLSYWSNRRRDNRHWCRLALDDLGEITFGTDQGCSTHRN